MSNNHLFLFTIGPVQSFIAQARKTQDLYAGSQILSCLVRVGILAFEQEFNGSKVIFPTFDRKASEVSLPNRFVAKISNHEWTTEELKAKAGKIQEAVKTALNEIAGLSLSNASTSTFDAFEKQLSGHLDIFWAFQPLEGNFSAAYKTLESLVGAVKNVRPFEQYAETGRKCSIDGIGNVLFYKNTEGNQKPAYITAEAKRLNTFLLNPGEGLSAASFVKRFYPKADKLPSTAEVALMHDEKQLSEERKKMLDCYKMLFTKEKLIEACLAMFKNGWLEKARITNPAEHEDWYDQSDDYQMLFEENLTVKVMPDATQLGLVRNLHAQLKSSFKTKYYALILFDGDSMGKWLAGENNVTKDNLEAFHTELSGLLSKFGSQARQSLSRESGNGYAVYAGGDDFMGFVNLHHLFDVMRNLREQFHEQVNEKLAPFKKADKELTFSAGIVIAHYKTPFSEVLQKARSIEKRAKKEGDKNAFAITVLKHSGEVQETGYKWDADADSPYLTSNWMALAHIVEALDKDGGHFSGKFIQNLTATFSQLTGYDFQEVEKMNRDAQYVEQAILIEIERLVSRALDKRQDPKMDSERVEKLIGQVQSLWKNAPYPKTQNFIHALHIADFLTRKTNQ